MRKQSACIHSLQYYMIWSWFYLVIFKGKTHRENPFFLLRVRIVSSADKRMRSRYQNNGGSNVLKRKISKLWRDIFLNCAPVHLGSNGFW